MSLRIKDFTKYSDIELMEISDAIYKERTERQHKKREKLIKAFEEAWHALEEAGLDIYYEETGDTLLFEDIEID